MPHNFSSHHNSYFFITLLLAGGIPSYFRISSQLYTYLLFITIFSFAIFFASSNKKSFGFLILCIFLWLGYWLKSVAHLLVTYPFREPMGYFSFSQGEWDKFYLIASLGMLTTIISGIFFFQLSGQSFLNRSSLALLRIRHKCNLRYLWVVGVIGAVILCAINYQFHFIAIGLHPSSIYHPWVIKSLISWLLGFGVISALYALLDVDLRTNTRFILKSILVLFIFLLLSISQSSRSVMVLSGLPMFLGLIVVYKKPAKKIIPILIIYFLFIVSSVYGSNYRRYEHDSKPAIQTNIDLEINNGASGNAADNQISRSSRLISSVAALAVDRWIGLEGLASVISYPNKSTDLLLSSLTEKRVGGTIDSYTLNVAQAFKDAPEKSGAIAVQYASIAGLFGMLYLADSLPLFCLGIFVIVGLIIFSERAVIFFTDNRMLAIFWSTSFVFTLSSLTIGVPQVARYYLFSFFAISVFGFLFRKYCFIYAKS